MRPGSDASREVINIDQPEPAQELLCHQATNAMVAYHDYGTFLGQFRHPRRQLIEGNE